MPLSILFSQHGPADDLVLHFLAKLYEIHTVTCNPHNEILVFLRLLLSLSQRVVFHADELHLAVAHG